MKLTSISILIVASVGCAGTAYRVISEGVIIDSEGWEKRQGGGSDGSPYQSTKFISKNIRITVLPCNYDAGFSTLILPLPVPLGSQPGIAKGNQFLIGVELFSPGNIEIYPGRTKLTINGNVYFPDKLSEKGSSCDLYRVPLGINSVSRDWVSVKSSYSLKSERFTYFTIWYDLPTPSTDTDFLLDFGNLKSNENIVQVPTMLFKKGSSWGGW